MLFGAEAGTVETRVKVAGGPSPTGGDTQHIRQTACEQCAEDRRYGHTPEKGGAPDEGKKAQRDKNDRIETGKVSPVAERPRGSSQVRTFCRGVVLTDKRQPLQVMLEHVQDQSRAPQEQAKNLPAIQAERPPHSAQ
jgi:hypothetical protein